MIGTYATLSASRVWSLDRRTEGVINEMGSNPHRVCICDDPKDAPLILKMIRIALDSETDKNEASDRTALLISQRNALLNAIEIAGFRLSHSKGLTLTIVPNDGTPDGANFVILQNLEPK